MPAPISTPAIIPTHVLGVAGFHLSMPAPEYIDEVWPRDENINHAQGEYHPVKEFSKDAEEQVLLQDDAIKALESLPAALDTESGIQGIEERSLAVFFVKRHVMRLPDHVADESNEGERDTNEQSPNKHSVVFLRHI